ncbi:MAG: zinc metallopeptidase [Clostridiales bacterium]|nr:zinc metallopeptidase [Clostridiales bacterium]
MYEYYLLFILLILVCAVFAGWASAKVHSTFKAYQDVGTSSRMTGYDTAVRLLRANGIKNISIGRVKGFLSDHYHPTKKVVNLSEGTYGNNSVAAVAVAAHEIGHVVQKQRGYIPYKIRTALVPITNIGSRLALPLVLVGLLLDIFVSTTQNSDVGFYTAMAGVALYGLSTLFALVTLPVELDASRRAKRMLVEQGVITQEELPYAEKMLSAAARTYLASLLTSLVYFLRFAMWVLILFGGRRRD